MITRMYDCDGCESVSEERVFRDTWTGKQLCCQCLTVVAPKLSMSVSDDNLEELLTEVL